VTKSHGSTFDPLTGRFVLVLEDLAVDACEFPDTLHPLNKDKSTPDRRAARASACDVLGPRPSMALFGLGRHRRAADRAAAEDVCASNRRQDRHPCREGADSSTTTTARSRD